jgi:hypothetical protein
MNPRKNNRAHLTVFHILGEQPVQKMLNPGHKYLISLEINLIAIGRSNLKLVIIPGSYV